MKSKEEELQTVITSEENGKKKIFFVIAGIALVLALGIGLSLKALSGGSAKKVTEQLNLGNKYLDELDFERAVMAYNAVLEIDSKNADAYIGLIEVYGLQGDAEKLTDVYLQAAKELDTGSKGDQAGLKKVQAKASLSLESMIQEALENGDIALAYNYLNLLIKVDEDIAETIREKIIEAEKTLSQVGSSIFFGHYEQDNDNSNGSEPIEWIVLDQEGERLLLISRYVLDAKRYYLEDYPSYHGWENSDMRWWLNHDFMQQAFDANEQAQILKTDLINEDINNFWGLGEENSKKQNPTSDKIFLLSIDEVLQYYGEDENQYDVMSTVYARAMYLDRIHSDPSTKDAAGEWGYDWSANSAPWALRSAGKGFPFALVDRKIRSADNTAYRYIGVRPVIWISDSQEEQEKSKNEGWESAEGADLFVEGKTNHMLSPDEITFLGEDFASLTFDRAQELVLANGARIGNRSHDIEDGFNYCVFTFDKEAFAVNGIFLYYNGAFIQYDDEPFVSVYFNWFGTSDKIPPTNTDTGIRGIMIGDTLGEVLTKLGFSNGNEIEARYEELCAQKFDTWDEMGEEKKKLEYHCTVDNLPDENMSFYISYGGVGARMNEDQTYSFDSYSLDIHYKDIDLKFDFQTMEFDEISGNQILRSFHMNHRVSN